MASSESSLLTQFSKLKTRGLSSDKDKPPIPLEGLAKVMQEMQEIDERLAKQHFRSLIRQLAKPSLLKNISFPEENAEGSTPRSISFSSNIYSPDYEGQQKSFSELLASVDRKINSMVLEEVCKRYSKEVADFIAPFLDISANFNDADKRPMDLKSARERLVKIYMELLTKAYGNDQATQARVTQWITENVLAQMPSEEGSPKWSITEEVYYPPAESLSRSPKSP